MKSATRKTSKPRWCQLPVSEAINQGLTFVLSALLSAGLNFLGLFKTLDWKNPVALALTVLVPMLVFVCHKLAMVDVAARQPSHLNEIVDDLLSIRIPTGKVVPNHANTKLLYVKYTVKDTWAVYMLDIPSKKTSLVREVVGEEGATEYSADRTVQILGWSPHDEYFAYVRRGRREVAICDGLSGAEIGKGQMNREITGSAWLNAHTLLCSDGGQIVGFSSDTKGWNKSVFYETPQNPAIAKTRKPRKHTAAEVTASNGSPNELNSNLPVGNIKSLAAFGLDSAVWQQSDAIYVREQGHELNTIWRTTNCTLVEFSFLPSAGKFLLHCKDDTGDFLTDYYPRVIWGKDVYTNVVRLEAGDYEPTEAQFINNGKGYAYLRSSEVGLSELVVRPDREKPPVELPWENEIRGFYINGYELYGITASDTEPPGIWACDFRTLIPRCLVSSVEQPFKYAENVPVTEGYVTNASGEKLTYYLLQPTRFERNRQYPLMVGNMGSGELGHTWDRLAQTVANCGGYFMCMDRRKRSPHDWADDVLSATRYLMKNYAVDTNNIYLLGVSAGSYTATSLLDSNPELWKGAFIFSMKQYPPVEGMQIRSLALDVGGLDVENVEGKLLQFQDDLAANGIRSTLMIHPKAGHYVRSTRLDRERMEQLVAFIRQP